MGVLVSMSFIDVKVSDLKVMIDELVADGVEFVEVSILERDKFDGAVLPATLHFGAFDGTGGVTDYEPIEEHEVDPYYELGESASENIVIIYRKSK